MRDRFGSTNERTLKIRFHTQTAGVSLTVQQPLNNIVRVAIQALAGVLGGTQSLHTDAYDEALALPTDRAALIALRTQQIIAEETGVANTVDPLGGSYFLEALTEKMEKGALGLFQQDRRDGRNGRSDRERLSAKRNPGLGVSVSEGRGTRRPDNCGRQ